MKKILLPLIFALGMTASAQTVGTLNTSLQNNSIISGFTPSDDPMFQSRFGFKKNGYALNAWTDYNLKKNNVRELDLNLSGPITTLDDITLSGYAGYFIFPNSQINDMNESGIILSKNISGITLSNYLAKFGGAGSDNGFINKINLIDAIPIDDKINVAASTQLVYNDRYFTQSSGFSHVSVSVDGAIKFSDMTLTARLYKQWMLSNNFNNAFKNSYCINIGIGKEF